MIEKFKQLDTPDASESSMDQDWQDLLPSVKRSNFYSFSVYNFNVYYAAFVATTLVAAASVGVYLYFNKTPMPAPQPEVPQKKTYTLPQKQEDTLSTKPMLPTTLSMPEHRVEKKKTTVVDTSRANPVTPTSTNLPEPEKKVPAQVAEEMKTDTITTPKVTDSPPVASPRSPVRKGKFKVLEDTVEVIEKKNRRTSVFGK